MSRLSKISWFVAGLSLLVLLVARLMLGGWINVMFIPLGLFLVGFLLAVIFDFRLYLEFFTMKTTKQGMSMGLIILLSMVLMVSINYLAVRHNKTWDLTEEKLNSLSDQTMQVLKNLNEDLNVKVFYRGEEANEEKQKIKQSLDVITESSPKVKVQYFDSYVEVMEAQKYLNDLPDKDRGNVFVFAEYGGKKAKIDPPYGEEQVTSAFIKVTRTGEKKVYFTTGHGERDIESAEADGIKMFKMALEEASFVVTPLNLVEKGGVPEDASIVVVAGPTTQFQEGELNWLRDYAKKGGRLLVAIDPGQRHNLAQLTKTFGVEFSNNYILNEYNQLLGRGVASAIGLHFDPSNDVTRSFQTGRNFAVFDLASELRPATDRSAGLVTTEIIRTDKNSFALNELSKNAKPSDRKQFAVAIAVSGKVDESSTKDFQAIIFGDSDFLTNKAFRQGLNQDVAMNSIASLANEKDLISIRSKQAKGTKMTLTRTAQLGVIFGCLALPLLLLIMSGVLWFRRRGA